MEGRSIRRAFPSGHREGVTVQGAFRPRRFRVILEQLGDRLVWQAMLGSEVGECAFVEAAHAAGAEKGNPHAPVPAGCQ